VHDHEGQLVFGRTTGLSDHEFATRAETAIRDAAERLGVTVPLVQVIAGWGDIFFVTIHVHATQVQGREQTERVFAEAADAALAPRRQSLKFSWIR
jgi:hypothetical protein